MDLALMAHMRLVALMLMNLARPRRVSGTAAPGQTSCARNRVLSAASSGVTTLLPQPLS
jgi:hypothetical protein